MPTAPGMISSPMMKVGAVSVICSLCDVEAGVEHRIHRRRVHVHFQRQAWLETRSAAALSAVALSHLAAAGEEVLVEGPVIDAGLTDENADARCLDRSGERSNSSRMTLRLGSSSSSAARSGRACRHSSQL